jgi:type IV pilus biogenesis protein CpaD/CtpE
MGVVALRDDVETRFHDRVALDEIELYTDVLSAVAATDRRLTQAEIDEVLGLVTRSPARAHPVST